MAGLDVRPPATGLTFLGYCSRPPWLWLVDLDARSIVPSGTALPGAVAGISEISVRGDWLAVHTHQELWSVPLGLDAGGRRLTPSFTFAPSVDGRTVWVEAPVGVRARHRLIAVDGQGVIARLFDLPEEWRLHAETTSGFVIHGHDEGRLAVLRAGEVRLLVEEGAQPLIGSNGSVVAWKRRDVEADLGLTDVAAGRTRTIRHQEVAEWQARASFSPDGRTLAIGGFPDRREPPTGSIGYPGPYAGRRAVMMLVDVPSGACRQVAGSTTTSPGPRRGRRTARGWRSQRRSRVGACTFSSPTRASSICSGSGGARRHRCWT